MSVLKLSKNDIIRNKDKEEKIKLKRSDISFDSAKLSGWEQSNRASLEIINNYNNRINKGEWLDEEDRSAYRKSLDTYISTSNSLRGLNKTFGEGYSDEDEQKWTDSIASMNKGYDEISGFYSQFGSEDSYNKWRKTEEYKSVINAGDFEANKGYSSTEIEIDDLSSFWGKLTSKYGLGYSDLTYEYINNQNGLRDEINSKYRTFSRDNSSAESESDYKQKGYDFLTDEEIGVYNYYYRTQGKDKAQEYLDTLETTLVQRKAGKEFERLKGNTLKEVFYGVVTGSEQWRQGVENLGSFITGEEGFTPSSQYVSGMVREDLADNGFNVLGSSVGQIGYDLLNTTSNMLPSILVGAATGSIGGLATMGASTVGNAYSEMRNLGYNEWQSRGYATLVGASEVMLQSLLGGIGKLGGKYSVSSGVTKLVSKFDNALAKLAIKVPLNMASEGLEEAIQTVLEPAFKALATGEDFEAPEWEEILYSGLLGALSAGTLEGTSSTIGAIGSMKTANKYRNIYGDNAVDLVAEALEIDPENAHAQKMQAKLDKGKSLSGYNIQHIVESNESALVSQDKGKIKAAAEARLTELGETGDVGKIAEAIAKYHSGEKLTKAEQALIANSKYGRRVSNGLNTEYIESGEYDTAWAEKIGTERINTEAYNRGITEASEVSTPQAETIPVSENATPKVNATEAKNEAPKESKVTITKDGEKVEVKPQKIASFENGEMFLELDGGEVVNASEVDFGEGGVGLVYQAANDMASRVGGFNVDTANVFVRGYNAESGLTAAEYVHGWSDAYRFGKMGVPVSELKRGTYTAKLSEEQRNTAYNFGKAFGNEETAKKQAKIVSTQTINADKDFKKADKNEKDEAKETKKESEAEKKTKAEEKAKREAEAKEKAVQKERVVEQSKKGFEFFNGLEETSAKATESFTIGNVVISLVKNSNPRYIDGVRAKFTVTAKVEGENGNWRPPEHFSSFEEAQIYASALSYEVADRVAESDSDITSEAQEAEVAEETEPVAKAEPSKASNTVSKKKGRVIFDGAKYGKTLNERQRASLKALRVIAEAMGIDIRIFESALVDGKRVGKNGSYDPDTKTLEIDLYAGVKGDSLMLFTASHELTHHIREVAPGKFKVFADALLEEYVKNGQSVEELIQKKLEVLEANGRLEGKTEAEAYDLAYEEVVADACESMLVDSNAIEALSKKLHEKDKGLWERIRDFISKLVNRIRAAYKGVDPDSHEGKLVREMQTSAERLQKLWVDALLEASEVSTEQTLGESGIIVNSETNSASLMSVRDVLSDADRKKVSKALAERFGVTQTEAMDWLKAETSLASLILNPKYSQYLDYTADANEEAIKSNSDYPQGTVDFSNICKKRRDFTEVMNRVLRNFPNHVFAATDLAKIRTIMEEEGMEVACAICYVEDRRQLDGPVAQDFIDSLAIYREGGKIRPDGKPFNANQLKAFKLIEGDTYTPSIYELISLKGRNSLKAKNPKMEEAWVKFNNARGMQSVRLLLNDAEYKRQILKYSPSVVKRKNDLGGLRIYSFSDMEMFHLIDIIQVITDSATVGLSLQGYTKVNEYARAVKDTGEKLNRSLIPKGDLGYHMEGGRVVLDFDTVEGIDINHPDFFDNIDNPNVGNIVIGINATQIKAAMTSKFIDQIIPFHTGQSGEVLGEKGIATWDNYKDFQSERDASTKKKSSHQINIYTEVINAAEAEGKPIKNKVDFVNKFLEVCKENNLIPRFSDFLDVNENGEYIYTEGYHKFLVDFKTFDQNTGEYLPQMPVKPIFDNEYITKLLTDYVKSQKVKDAEVAKAMPKVLDRITKEIVKSDGAKYSDRDSLGNELSKEQQEFFKDSKVRDSKGRLLKLYHGTDSDITVFDESYSQDGTSLFLTDSEYVASTYTTTGKMMPLYANLVNPLIVDAKGKDSYHIPVPKELEYMQLGKIAEARQLAYYAKGLGHDGVIIKNVVDVAGFAAPRKATDVIAFNAEQLKDVTNKSPTSDPDIRYSDRDSSYLDAVKRGDMATAQKMVDEAAKKAGYTIKGSHGTLSYFTIFDRSFGNPEGDWGKGFYFTNNEDDVETNYASEDGADLQVKIEKYAQQLGWTEEYGDLDFDELIEVARKELTKGDPRVIKAYLRMENPVIIGGPNETYFDFTEEYDEETDEYGEPTGKLVEFVEALSSILEEYTANGAIGADRVDVYELFQDGDGYTASQLEKAASELLENVMDENGDYASKEIIRAAFEEIGFDGIVDNTVAGKFGDRSGRKNAMVGVTLDTTHYIAFKSNQIKQSDPVVRDDNGNVIPLSERFNPKNSDIRYSDRNPYSYEALTSKPDMKLATVGGNVPNNRADIVAEAKKNAAKVGRFNPKDGSVSVRVADVGTDVLLGTDGLKHGLRRSKDLQNDVNAIVTVKAGEILKNSIRINELIPSKVNATGSYVLIGAASNANGDLYIVRSVVNQFNNELTAMDVLYAVNAKKEELAALNAPRSTAKPLSVTNSDISIAQLLDFVNKYFPDILPESVLRHYGHTERPKGELGKSALYQDRNPDSYSNRSLLANALETAVQNDIEREKLRQYKEKIGLINSEEQKLHDLREQIKELSFAKGPRDTQAIRNLQFEANQAANRINTYDKQLLNLESTKALKGVLEREKALARKRDAQKYKESLERYREKASKTQRELMERYQESRKRGVESRNKTAMRHKIRDVVKELNKLLNRGTKERNVKEEIRETVATSLVLAEVIFSNDIRNEDIVRLGVDSVTEKESKLLNEYSDLLDTIDALYDKREYFYGTEKVREELLAKVGSVEEQIAKIRNRISTLNSQLSEVFERERARLNRSTASQIMANLASEYQKLKDSDTDYIRAAYDEYIFTRLDALKDSIGGTVARDMSLEQLTEVYDAYKMVEHFVRNANKAFKAQKGETITQMAEAVNGQVRDIAGQPYKHNVIKSFLMKAGWKLLKPFVAFRTIGSVTLTNLYKELRVGEDVFYNDVKAAQAFIEEQYKKHNYKSWDLKKPKEFTAKSGKTFQLTLEQRLSMYAYYKREKAHKHIVEGGIVFENSIVTEKNKLGIPIAYDVTTKDAFNLSEETFAEIANSLTEEQKAFVDAMQEYLSTVMGEKGNEVSMELHGVKLFKEEFYLPIKSSEFYMNFKPEEAGEVRLKSPAFSKETTPHANNPIVLHNFTDLWAEHVNNMSMYHSFVLALEDFTRVYNYKTKTDAKVETMDTKATLETAYPGVTNYINKFLKDMNGGVRSETVGGLDKLVSLSKKGAVLGSWSVAIQQPSAVMRSMSMINPKYFVTTAHKSLNLLKHKQDWAELKKYAPIAGIKEMGRFDVGMGQSTVDWIQSNKTLMEKGEDALSAAPAFMDEVTWVTIWNAVKRETANKNPKLNTSSEEFLKLAGERFTDVISMTQVYDSVFSRSDLMRNKSWIAKAVTAFMAEPTTTLNMIWDSWVQAKRTGGFKAYAKATVTTGAPIMASIVLNAALKSIIMAMRDDDEDESYGEKYLESLFGEIKDNLNPLTLIPIAKDIVSIFRGYDVERMDMALISDFKKALDAFDSEEKTLYEKWSGLIGATSAFFGIPIKNVERDFRGLINTFFGKTEDATTMGILNAIEEGWSGEEKSNGQQLYEAMLKGDTEQIERVEGRFKEQKDIDAAIRKALRENDPRIKEAAEAFLDGNYDTYNALREEIVAEGNFSRTLVTDALKAEYNYLKKKAEEDN